MPRHPTLSREPAGLTCGRYAACFAMPRIRGQGASLAGFRRMPAYAEPKHSHTSAANPGAPSDAPCRPLYAALFRPWPERT